MSKKSSSQSLIRGPWDSGHVVIAANEEATMLERSQQIAGPGRTSADMTDAAGR
jgi:hypothetical protein